jgi:hypothetical protein
MQEAGQRAFPFQLVLTVHAGIEMSAKIFELLLAEVVVHPAANIAPDQPQLLLSSTTQG